MNLMMIGDFRTHLVMFFRTRDFLKFIFAFVPGLPAAAFVALEACHYKKMTRVLLYKIQRKINIQKWAKACKCYSHSPIAF